MFSKEKSLVEKAKESKSLSNIFITLILAFLIVIGGQLIGGVIERITKNFIGNNPVALFNNMLITNFIFIILLVFAVVKFKEKRKISSIGLKKQSFVLKYIVGFFIGLIIFSTLVLLLKLTGHIAINNSPKTPSGLAALASVLMVIPGWMVQSAGEEVLVRGWIMNVLGARYSIKTGIIASSSFFGVMHFLNPNASIIAIVNLILTGMFFGMYVLRTNDLWGACGIHAAWNWIQGNGFGFEVSGETFDVGSIMHLQLTGANWITGGSFGPEAGFMSTVVISIALVIVYFMPSKV